MVELCDSEKLLLDIVAGTLLVFGGLISPIATPFIARLFTRDSLPAQRPTRFGWGVVGVIILAGTLTGAFSANAEIKLCDRIVIVSLRCDAAAGDDVAGEVVSLENQDDHQINMDHWKLCDYQDKHCYRFEQFKLAEQARVDLWTRAGRDTPDALYWNLNAPVWNDEQDTARLLDKKGRVVDELACPREAATHTPAPTTLPTPTPSLTSTAVPTQAPTRPPEPTPVVPPGAACLGYEYVDFGDGEAMQAAMVYHAAVTRVIDGDTIEIDDGDQLSEVRYAGIDAPALDAIFGREAYERNRALVEGREIYLFWDDDYWQDQAGRPLRYVVAGNYFVNYELLRYGFAQFSMEYADRSCQETFIAAENDARLLRLGLWELFTIPVEK